MQADDRPLVLDTDPGQRELRSVQGVDEASGVVLVAVERRIGANLGVPGHQQLHPVVSRVEELVQPDHPAGVLGAAAAEAADECIALGQPAKQLASVVGDTGLGRVMDDRSDRAIDVGEDRRAVRPLSERRYQGGWSVAIDVVGLCAPAVHAL